MVGLICPDCKWEPPSTPYKMRRDGKVYVYKEGEEIPPSAYPKILELYVDHNNRKVFREVHRCSKCLLEIEQTRVVDN